MSYYPKDFTPQHSNGGNIRYPNHIQQSYNAVPIPHTEFMVSQNFQPPYNMIQAPVNYHLVDPNVQTAPAPDAFALHYSNRMSYNTTKVRKRAFSRRSKTGCRTCRERRIKCDEQRPFCKNCAKSKRCCVYVESRDSKEKKTPPSTANVSEASDSPSETVDKFTQSQQSLLPAGEFTQLVNEEDAPTMTRTSSSFLASSLTTNPDLNSIANSASKKIANPSSPLPTNFAKSESNTLDGTSLQKSTFTEENMLVGKKESEIDNAGTTAPTTAETSPCLKNNEKDFRNHIQNNDYQKGLSFLQSPQQGYYHPPPSHSQFQHHNHYSQQFSQMLHPHPSLQSHTPQFIPPNNFSNQFQCYPQNQPQTSSQYYPIENTHDVRDPNTSAYQYSNNTEHGEYGYYPINIAQQQHLDGQRNSPSFNHPISFPKNHLASPLYHSQPTQTGQPSLPSRKTNYHYL